MAEDLLMAKGIGAAKVIDCSSYDSVLTSQVIIITFFLEPPPDTYRGCRERAEHLGYGIRKKQWCRLGWQGAFMPTTLSSFLPSRHRC